MRRPAPAALLPVLLLVLLGAPAHAEEAATLARSIGARGSATLEDCFALAVVASESVGIADAQAQQSRARHRAGVGALLPQISGEGTYFRQDSVVVGSGGESFVATEDERTQVRLRLEQAITRFGAEAAGLSELRQLREAAEASREEARRQLYRAVATAFTGVLRGEREIAVREESVEAGLERSREMDARQEVGLARRAEALAVRTQLSSDQAALEEARSAVAIARQDLAIAIGLPVEVHLVPPPIPDPAAGGGAEPLPDAELDAALGVRPDIRAARLAEGAARSHARFVRGDLLPALDLAANYYVARDGFSQFQEETDWDATLTLAIPIFAGGTGQARLAEARAQADEAALVRGDAERRARRDVRSAEVTLRSTAARLRTLEDGLAFATESAALATEEYRQGISTNLEVETARVALLEARLAVERQRLALLLARIELDLSLGREPAYPTPKPPAANEETP